MDISSVEMANNGKNGLKWPKMAENGRKWQKMAKWRIGHLNLFIIF